eukprot:3601243-Prymnesium_polylepis.1
MLLGEVAPLPKLEQALDPRLPLALAAPAGHEPHRRRVGLLGTPVLPRLELAAHGGAAHLAEQLAGDGGGGAVGAHEREKLRQVEGRDQPRLLRRQRRRPLRAGLEDDHLADDRAGGAHEL